MSERIEEYRYQSGSIGDMRELTVRVIAIRLLAFYKTVKRINAAKGGSQGGKASRRRMNR